MPQDPNTSQDKVQHLPVDSTETLPLLTTADPEQQDASISDEEAYAKLKAKQFVPFIAFCRQHNDRHL